METGTIAIGSIHIFIYIYIPMVIPTSYLYIPWTKLQVKPLVLLLIYIYRQIDRQILHYIYKYTYIYIYTFHCIYYIYVIIHVYYVYFSTEPPFLLAFIISVHCLTSTLNAPLRFDQDILRNMSQKLSDREALKKPFRRKARRCALFGPP